MSSCGNYNHGNESSNNYFDLTKNNQSNNLCRMKSVGENIKEKREALGWSQEELARRVGLTQPAVVKIERGGKTRKITDFARAFGCSAEELELGHASKNESAPLPVIALRVAEREREAEFSLEARRIIESTLVMERIRRDAVIASALKNSAVGSTIAAETTYQTNPNIVHKPQGSPNQQKELAAYQVANLQKLLEEEGNEPTNGAKP